MGRMRPGAPAPEETTGPWMPLCSDGGSSWEFPTPPHPERQHLFPGALWGQVSGLEVCSALLSVPLCFHSGRISSDSRGREAWSGEGQSGVGWGGEAVIISFGLSLLASHSYLPPAFPECWSHLIHQHQRPPASRQKVPKYLAERVCGIKRFL